MYLFTPKFHLYMHIFRFYHVRKTCCVFSLIIIYILKLTISIIIYEFTRIYIVLNINLSMSFIPKRSLIVIFDVLHKFWSLEHNECFLLYRLVQRYPTLFNRIKQKKGKSWMKAWIFQHFKLKKMTFKKVNFFMEWNETI